MSIIHKEYKDSPPSEKVIDDLIDKHFFLRYAPGETVKNMKKAARGVIKNYVDGHAADFRNILETEKKFEFMLEDASIAGQIDLIKKIDKEGSLREIEVVDFKSDSSLLYKKDYDHQLRLYVIACISALKLRPQKACIHDLEKGGKRYIDISENMLNETKNDLVGRIDNIKTKKFVPQKDKAICKDCDYHLICRFNH